MGKSFRPPKDASSALLALTRRTTAPSGMGASNVVRPKGVFGRAAGSRGAISSPGLAALTPGR